MADEEWKPVTKATDDEEWRPVQTPSTTEDIENTTAPALGRGSLMAITGIPTVVDLANQGIAKLGDKLGYPDSAFVKYAKKTHENLAPYTYGPALEAVKKGYDVPYYGHVSGVGDQLDYQPKTTAGQYYNSALETVPSAIYGPTRLGEMAFRGALGGLGSEAGSQFIHKVLPQSWADTIDPYVRAIAGYKAAKTGPGVITPNPASTATKAATSTLEEAGMPLSAGQRTGNPKLLQYEANIGRTADTDNANFTKVLANQAGMPNVEDLSPASFSKGGQNFNDYINTLDKTRITAPNFTQLQSDLGGVAKEARTIDSGLTDKIQKFIEDTKTSSGGAHQPTPMDMKGARYRELRQQVEQHIENASNTGTSFGGTEAGLWSKVLNHLDNAMGKEIPDLADTHGAYKNFRLLEGSRNIKGGVITPEDLRPDLQRQMGTRAYNQGEGLAGVNQAAEKVLPRPPLKEPGPLVNTTGAVAGAAIAHGLGIGDIGNALVGGILGGERAADIVKLLRKGGAPVYNAIEPYLGNQILSRPEGKTTLSNILRGTPPIQPTNFIDRGAAINLLRGKAASQVQNQVNGPQQ